MPKITTLEIGYHDGTAARLLTVSDRVGFVTTGADTPPHTAFLPSANQIGSFSVNAVRVGATTGNSESAFGGVELQNVGGAYDFMSEYGFTGRTVTIRQGDSGAAYPGEFVTVFAGVIAKAEFSNAAVKFTITDRQATLKLPLQNAFYGGTNALPAGIDGVATDLKGKPKPRVYGQVRKAPPVLVNTSRLIYQLSDKNGSVSAVFDGGAALTAGAAYSSQADMETTAPSAGQYRVWASAAGIFIRLGSSAVRGVTVDAADTSSGSAAQLLKLIAIDAGIASGDISAADVTALDALNAAVCGYYVSGTESAITAMDFVANSIASFYYFNALQALRIGRIDAPIGSAVLTLTTADIQTLERTTTSDAGGGVPCKRVELQYQPYWLVQPPSAVVGSVTEAVRAELTQEFRTVSDQDLSITTMHLNAPILQFTTALDSAAAAQAECTRRLNLYKAARMPLTVNCVGLRTTDLALCVPGAVVRVVFPRFGLSAGRDFIVLGYTVNLNKDAVQLDLWG